MRCELAHHIAVEGDKIRNPEAEEDGKQQQWVFGRFADRLSLLHEQTCALRSHLRFGRSKPFEMDKRRYERDLKLDLLTT